MTIFNKKIEVAVAINNCLLIYKNEGYILNRFTGQKATLSDSEIGIILELNSSPGKIFRRKYLLEACWAGRVVTNSSLNVAMSNIRKKMKEVIEDDVEIITVPKKGYALEVKNSRNKKEKNLVVKDNESLKKELVDTKEESNKEKESFSYSCAVYVLSTMITMIMLVDIVWI